MKPSIVGTNTEIVLQKLAAGSIDIGLIEGPAMRRDLKIEPFLNDSLTLVVPPRHDFAERAHVSPGDIAAEPLIMREEGSGTRRIVEAALKHAGLKLKRLKIVMELDSGEAIKSAVEAGLGIGFVPIRATEKELKLGTLRRVEVQGVSLTRKFSAAYRRSPDLTGTAAAFLAFVRSLDDRHMRRA